MGAPELGDLIVLAADESMAEVLRVVLGRHQALDIRGISASILVHPARDPGCRTKADDMLRSFTGAYDRALVVFDREGCGRDHLSREALEAEVRGGLCRAGWGDRAEVVVIDPELEAWVWSDSPHVEAALGWGDRRPKLRQWLQDQQLLREGDAKPLQPKEAYERALRAVGVSTSRRIFRKLAQTVSLGRCEDPAFLKLKRILREWFPPAGH